MGRMKTALEAIRDLDVELETLPRGFNDGCSHCEVVRRKQWPPSLLCNKHYKQRAIVEQRNDRARSTQHHEMRRIARDALEGL